MENQINMNFDLKNTQEVLTPSGGKVWQQGFVIRKVSKFITGTSEDAVMPIPVFYDPKTGEILQDTLPKELRDAQPENNLRLVKPDNAN
jgi:hypothetical protein